MKPSLYLLLLLPFKSPAPSNSFRHNSILEVKFVQYDFKSKGLLGNYNNMSSGIAIGFLKGVNKRLDYMVGVSGSFPDSASKEVQKSKTLLLEASGLLRARLFDPQRQLQPYLVSGAGASYYKQDFGMFIPLGAGVQFYYKDVFVLLTAQYRYGIASINNHFFYSIGIAGTINKPKAKAHKQTALPLPPTAKQFLDSDGDGVLDTSDNCPTAPGLAKYQGCPDSDGDGIVNQKDKCPQQPGPVAYMGCPVPDSDGDGINDEEDSCRMVAGVIRYKGCPVPDRDGDGISDEEDRCVEVFGVKERQGCPEVKKQLSEEIQKAAQNIFFETGSYKLLPTSYPALQKIVEILKADKGLRLQIEGHTDSQGGKEMNQQLSKNRAQAVLDYLKSKGIEEHRLSAQGYGMTKPIADNNTGEGRARNRRVELKLGY